MPRQVATREVLVEAARVLFWKQGYEATSTAQILEAAEAGSGSLYYFFASKEELLLAVLEWYKANLHKMVVEPVFKRVKDPIERVFGILEGYRIQLQRTKFEHGCPVGSLALELSNSQPAARRLIAENFTAWCAVIDKCLNEIKHRLPPGADTKQMSQFILTTMEGAVMLARSYRSLAPYEAAVAQLRKYFKCMLQKPRGKRTTSTSKKEK